MNIFKKKSKKVVHDVSQSELVHKVGKASLFMKTIGIISNINTNPPMENSDTTQMTTMTSSDNIRSKGNKASNAEARLIELKQARVRAGELKTQEDKSSAAKHENGERDKTGSNNRLTGAKSALVDGKSKGSRSRIGKAVAERPSSIKVNAIVSERTNGANTNDYTVSLDQSGLSKKKSHILDIDQSITKKDIEELRSPVGSPNKPPPTLKPIPSNPSMNNLNLNINSANNTKEIFWEIADFDLSKPLYESNTFSYADQCWNFIFGHNGSDNYGFLMSLHQPQIATIQFKCTFRLHHPFAFPLSKTREEPYVFGINSRTIRGFVNFASREEVSRHLQEGGILKLSAVLKLGTVVLVNGTQLEGGQSQSGLKTSDDRIDRESNRNPLFTSSFIGDTQQTKMTCDNEMLRGRAAVPASPTESEPESWLPCFGLSFSIFRSAASFRGICSSMSRSKAERNKMKKKDLELRGRSKKEEGSFSLFSRKTTVRSSDSENDSDGDEDRNDGWKYYRKREEQRRSTELSEKRDGKARGQKNRVIGDKGRHKDLLNESDSNRQSSKRDNLDAGQNREIQNLLQGRNILSGRDCGVEAPQTGRKSGRYDDKGDKLSRHAKEADTHERNKSFSPGASKGVEKKMTERHFRHNSSMI